MEDVNWHQVHGQESDFTRAFEIRDKNKPPHVVLALVEKVAHPGFAHAALVATASDQELLDASRLSERAPESALGLQNYIGRDLLVIFFFGSKGH